jgi:peptidoglycan/LPS O-acetylase OafA/YrhL
MKRLPNIQMLRACAAMMIVIYHCGIETTRLAGTLGRDGLFNYDAWGAGVPIFFAISGFIMVVTSAHMFGSRSAATDFMRRRIIRIVPLYWLVTTAAFAALLVAPSLMKKVPQGDYLYVVASYLFWPYVRLTGDVRPLATPGWTLNLEMLFYVVFAFALLFPRRVGFSVLFGSLGLLVTARVIGLLPGVALNFWGDPIVVGFLFGAAVGLAYNNGVRLSGWWAALILLIGFIGVFELKITGFAEDSLVVRIGYAIPATVILIAVALGPQVDEGSRLWWPALAIGDASYSLYLVQEFMLRSLHLVWLKGILSIFPLWTFIPLGIAIALLVAFASYRLFERPMTRWLNGVGRPRRIGFSVPLAESQPSAARI